MRASTRRRSPVIVDAADLETRDRLLASAAHLFAARGFKQVTVREICRRARANVAAVNYHFGGKLGLYRDVLQSAIDIMRSTNDAVRAAGEGRPAEERLHAYVQVYLRRVLAAGGDTWIHRLIHREVTDPTPVLDELVDRGVRPRLEYLSAVVAELLDCAPADPQVLRCVTSIQAQTLFYLPNPIASRLGVEQPLTPAQIDELVRHIVAFSLAGIRAVARSTCNLATIEATDDAAAPSGPETEQGRTAARSVPSVMESS